MAGLTEMDLSDLANLLRAYGRRTADTFNQAGREASPYPVEDERSWQDIGDKSLDVALRFGPGAMRPTKDIGPLRPYESASDALMGYSAHGPQKSFAERAATYKFTQPLLVEFENGNSFVDGMNGLNKSHAIERARRNWPGAKITPITPEEALARDPASGSWTP